MRKLVLLFAVILIMATLSGCLGGDENKDEENTITYASKTGGLWGPYSDRTEEGTDTMVAVSFNDTYIAEVIFRLTWTDTNNNGDPEPAQDDQFTMEVTPPNGSGEPESRTAAGSSLQVTVKTAQKLDEPMENGVGWNVRISIDAGEGTTGPGPGPFIIYTDNGNDWTLNAEYKYLKAQEEGE